MEASPTTRTRTFGAAATSLMLLAQPDAVLCRLAARGNPGAYDALYQRHYRPVFAFVFHLLGRGGSAADAEDIAQDTFTKAFAGIQGKRADGAFRHWIFTIARNTAFDHMRAAGAGTVTMEEGAVELVAPAAGSAAAAAEGRAEFAWLITAMTELPARQREALVMRELGGMSHDEIAHALNTTVPATKKLISRGRATVGEAAESNGLRRPRLARDLALAAPLPIAASGIAAGGAAAGGVVLTAKIAAALLAVAALGGGVAAVETATTGGTASSAAAADAATAAAPGSGKSSASGKSDGDRGGARQRRSGGDAGGPSRGGHAGQRENSSGDALPHRSDGGSGSGDGNGRRSDGSVGKGDSPGDAERAAPGAESDANAGGGSDSGSDSSASGQDAPEADPAPGDAAPGSGDPQTQSEGSGSDPGATE